MILLQGGAPSLKKYKIFETANLKKQIENLDKYQAQQLYPQKNIVDPQLRQELHYGSNIRKLKNYDPKTGLYRIGNYRIFFEINHTENVVAIIAMKLRKDAY